MINTGLGPLELLVVGALVLMFFGSRELPFLIREIARLMGKIRAYGEKVRREMDSVTSSFTETGETVEEEDTAGIKARLRDRYGAARKALTPRERHEKSELIWGVLRASEAYRNASSIMIYCSTGAEVRTREVIPAMLAEGKRIILPFCRVTTQELGIAEVREFPGDTEPGQYGILEPREPLRGNFFKSDLRLILVPGVSFDRHGTRLGRGQGYYDSFLEDVNGRIPIMGLAFNCQISPEPLPADYHDVGVDDVLTEDGWLISPHTEDT